ncbi:MAG: hypothetical protein KAS88_04915 [Deltaproteobacteria bacterium]|nr:hypothetical protein [Deltaproteobacteria bacterium]
MSLNSHLEDILGKNIVGVLAKKGDTTPLNQVFFFFDDGTYFEFYGADIQNAKGLVSESIEEVRRFSPERKIICEFHK